MEGGGSVFLVFLYIFLSFLVFEVYLFVSGFLEKVFVIINIFLGIYVVCSLNFIRYNRNFLYFKGINIEI